MIASFLGFSTVFILLIWLILIRRKRPLDKEEKKYFILGLTIGIGVSVILGIFPILQYYGVPPPNLLPLVPFLIWVVATTLSLTAIGIAYQKRIKIGQILDNKYLNKLERKIRQELETEAKNKQLTFTENHLEFLPYMATNLARSIMNKSPPITYVAALGDHIREKRFTMINQYGSMIPFSEGKIIAKKMTEISKRSRYRKKALFLLLP